MGLDNGIKLTLPNPLNEDAVSWYAKLEKMKYEEGNLYEVCYWRKCWGIRNAILEAIHYNHRGDPAYKDDQVYYKVDVQDLKDIYKILESFMNPNKWKEDADSIWEYDDYIGQSLHNIKNLMWLIDFIIRNPDIEVDCEFYDSY